MSDMVLRAGLSVDARLVRFLEEDVLRGLDTEPQRFWAGAADIFARFAPQNARLLGVRDAMQAHLDAWHAGRAGSLHDTGAYQAFLREIGYLVEPPAPFAVAPHSVDDEVAQIAGPQLVVPVLNARFLLNAANARWGSLYDALYGTDAIETPPAAKGYDAAHGAKVIAWAKAFLDRAVPLAVGSHTEAKGYAVREGALVPALADPAAFQGYRGDPDNPSAVLLRHHGLHIELVLDRRHPIGKDDPAGLADVLLESALTTIVDLEDSVAAVDAEDKVAAYANWLGLMRGDLEARFDKGGRVLTRTLEPDRRYTAPDGGERVLPGRALLFVRNVGHLMTTPAVRLADGSEAPEGVLDAIVTSLIALYDLRGLGRVRNSRAGSIYIVKPKMHGPDEAAFTDRLFDAVEDLLGLARHTIKVGVMDEERRTSANLAACIAAVKDRIVFINTGFLDRTGDEMHTVDAGRGDDPQGRDEGRRAWIAAYEDRNVQIGVGRGLRRPRPDRQGHVGGAGPHGRHAGPEDRPPSRRREHRLGSLAHRRHPARHPLSRTRRGRPPGRTRGRAGRRPRPACSRFPWRRGATGQARRWRKELDNNAQGILGYVVRWIDQGVGCSKVPDIHDVGLMEDRATLRISSQHMANWMLHGVASAEDVDAALSRMAAKVDAQNGGDPLYQPMAGHETDSLAFQAARALVFQGTEQPNGYTEPLLHSYRARAKARG